MVPVIINKDQRSKIKTIKYPLFHKRLKQTAMKALINAYDTYVCNSRDEPPSQSIND